MLSRRRRQVVAATVLIGVNVGQRGPLKPGGLARRIVLIGAIGLSVFWERNAV